MLRKHSRKRARASVSLVVAALCLVIFPLLVALAYYSSQRLLPIVANLQFTAPTMPPRTLEQQRPPAPLAPNGSLLPTAINFSLPNIPFLTYSNLLLFAVAVVICLVCIRAFRMMRARTEPFSKGEVAFDEEGLLDDERGRVASILDQTARELRSDSDYREAVIRCYKLISHALEAKSSIDGRTLTASEFREVISERLKFDSPYLSKATLLFEVARYSEHEITHEDALEASDCLSNLSEALREHVAPVS